MHVSGNHWIAIAGNTGGKIHVYKNSMGSSDLLEKK